MFFVDHGFQAQFLLNPDAPGGPEIITPANLASWLDNMELPAVLNNGAEDKPTIAEMSAGSVLIYDGSLWHGGGASTAKDARRRCINNIFTRQWLRQQNTRYLSIPKETVIGLPKLMQRLLGYWIYSFTLGVVDGRPPIEVLREEKE